MTEKEYCSHCAGFGSSLKDPENVPVCSACGGSGLMEDEVRLMAYNQAVFELDGTRRDF